MSDNQAKKPGFLNKIRSLFTKKIPTVVTSNTFNPPEIDIDEIYSDRVENYTFQRYDTYKDDCLDAIKMAEFALDAGDDYSAKKNYSKARDYYDRAIRELNAVTDCTEEYTDVIKFTTALLYTRKGHVYTFERKYSPAVEEFKKALEYAPNNEQILSYIEKYKSTAVGGRRRHTYKKHKKSKRMTRKTK